MTGFDDSNRYQKLLTKFQAEIDSYQEGGDADANQQVQAHLRECLQSVESFFDTSLEEKLRNQLKKTLEKLSELSPKQESPFQSLVFYFNRDHAEIVLTGYGSLGPAKSIRKPKPEIGFYSAEKLFTVPGAITIPGYVDLFYELTSEREIAGCDLEIEVDSLNELLILRTYAGFKDIFL